MYDHIPRRQSAPGIIAYDLAVSIPAYSNPSLVSHSGIGEQSEASSDLISGANDSIACLFSCAH